MVSARRGPKYGFGVLVTQRPGQSPGCMGTQGVPVPSTCAPWSLPRLGLSLRYPLSPSRLSSTLVPLSL